LTKYVDEYYKQGVTWNNKDGIDAGEAMRHLDAPPTAAGVSSAPLGLTGPSPPPPPPPAPSFESLLQPRQEKSKGGDMGAVFADLQKGETVTSGLKKVDKSQMTHKNPSLRASSVVPTRSDSMNSNSSRGKSPAPGLKPKPEGLRNKKPPRKVLDGNKWIIVGCII
jgi:adenylyl cyclase-associated protein